jgi:acetolactate synthase regulatory subunit
LTTGVVAHRLSPALSAGISGVESRLFNNFRQLPQGGAAGEKRWTGTPWGKTDTICLGILNTMDFSNYDMPDRAERIFKEYIPDMSQFEERQREAIEEVVKNESTCDGLDLALDKIFDKRSIHICGPAMDTPHDADAMGYQSIAIRKMEDIDDHLDHR